MRVRLVRQEVRSQRASARSPLYLEDDWRTGERRAQLGSILGLTHRVALQQLPGVGGWRSLHLTCHVMQKEDCLG